MTISIHKSAITFLLIVTTGCTLQTATPTIEPIVDSFFSGYAYLDVNDNGELDAEDTPVEGAAFIVTLQFGGEVGAFTDSTGYAFIVVPGGADYPVTMRMESPKDNDLILIGPTEVIQDQADPAPKFLFSSK